MPKLDASSVRVSYIPKIQLDHSHKCGVNIDFDMPWAKDESHVTKLFLSHVCAHPIFADTTHMINTRAIQKFALPVVGLFKN